MNQHSNEKVDLDNCDREPIHIPGSIQPHGVLLAFDPQSLVLRYWSQNAAMLLGRKVTLTETPESLFGARTAAAIRQISQESPAVVVPIDGGATIGREDENIRHTAAAHLHAGMLLLEIEIAPIDKIHSRAISKLPRLLKTATHRMQACQTMEELYSAIATQIKSLSGFDRVMIYRFLEGGHGAVVGEAAESHLESFLGLHYPASDIPQQARRLYELNAVRLIADIHAPPVPIAAADSDAQQPLDLTFSYFRSVSPIHIEYLQNMGVAASMSISILQGGDLWGMIACHHYEPRNLTLEVRDACELIGVAAGVYLGSRQLALENQIYRVRRDALHQTLRTAAAGESFRAGIEAALPIMPQIVDAEEALVCLDGKILTLRNESPTIQSLIPLIPQIAAATSGPLFYTDSLRTHFPSSAPIRAEVAGVLAIRIGESPLDIMLFVRPEYAHEVSWAGKPQKEEVATAHGIRLSPRKSFETWREIVRDHSRKWSTVDRDMALELHNGLAELLGRRAIELTRINEELSRINADLDSFAFAASHDLREQLRNLHQAITMFEAKLHRPLTSEEGIRFETIQRSRSRLDELLEGLLRMSRAGRGDLVLEPIQITAVAQEAAEMIWGSVSPHEVQLTIEEMPEANADFMCVREIYCNLFSNATKYNSNLPKIVHAGTMVAGAAAPAAYRGRNVFFVRDNGIGVAPQDQERIFEIFKRLHLPHEFGGGSGAGLTIVKKVVERHGGSIWVESPANQGTIFCFTLEAI
ncbi:ATP-binding protein [Blastopirellula marina]|uniref:histidine kinase n=1 Tax=Blastopirellula marina DSM 3645 TaxID=314230 RepID=A4A1X6_9BACT|nr:ATP-binding protein [Blastopirellula marina]EAQ77210.1 Multi-sensor Signal Transduction Histidine Kinase [Blastopirellula marina DSM 3645]